MFRLVKSLLPFSAVFITACLWKDSGNDDNGDDEQQIRIEGTEIGDCTDGADNDGDGRYDCDDDSCAGAPACQEDTGEGQDTSVENQGHQTLSTTILTFTNGEGETSTYHFILEQDGSTTIDGINVRTEPYTVAVSFIDGPVNSADNITPEIAENGHKYQVLFTGQVDGCTTEDVLFQHQYSDADENGLPIGLQNTITPIAEGTGELIVSLRLLEDENGQTNKTVTLAEDYCNGIDIPGSWLVTATFPLVSSHP